MNSGQRPAMLPSEMRSQSSMMSPPAQSFLDRVACGLCDSAAPVMELAAHIVKRPVRNLQSHNVNFPRKEWCAANSSNSQKMPVTRASMQRRNSSNQDKDMLTHCSTVVNGINEWDNRHNRVTGGSPPTSVNKIISGWSKIMGGGAPEQGRGSKTPPVVEQNDAVWHLADFAVRQSAILVRYRVAGSQFGW